ncbi:osmiophilic body protein [Plasmodium gaboni]|uniref:Osmiophilic body protein n=1 Tax=Plasmodium gaboni TaxID=647221 RepID=A0ABY1UQY4_9APIC|nr:osmiophilic body protein [Plasmodium gaboni]
MKFLSFFFLSFIFLQLIYGKKVLNFENIIKHLKESKLLPEDIPHLLENDLIIVPPYLIYKYKGKIYHLHNNVDVTLINHPEEDSCDKEEIWESPFAPKEPEQERPQEPELVPQVEPESGPLPEEVKEPEPEPELEPELEVREEEEAEEEVIEGDMVLDEETGIKIPKKTDEDILDVSKIRDEYDLPKVVELTSEEKEKNNILHFGGNKSTAFNLKEIINYKGDESIVNSLASSFDHFYTPNVEERNISNGYNVDIKDYYDLLRALHILCKEEDNKLYTINRIPKDEVLFFLKHAYVNIYNSLKKYILLNGYNFEDYIYSSENFTLDQFFKDYFFLSNDDTNENGTFNNIIESIKYIKKAKEKLNVKRIEEKIKYFFQIYNVHAFDFKLLHYLFSRNQIINYNEDDLIHHAVDIMNITRVDISPRVISALFMYFLNKVNIFLVPQYATINKKNDFTLLLEHNDLLLRTEIIYRDFLRHFFKHKLLHLKLKKKNHDNAYQLVPWSQTLFSEFDSTYNFLHFKYLIILFHDSYYAFVDYFEGKDKLNQVLKDNKENKNIDNLDKFLNELLNLFLIEKVGILSTLEEYFVSTVKQVGRTLSDDHHFDYSEYTDNYFTPEEEEQALKDFKEEEYLEHDFHHNENDMDHYYEYQGDFDSYEEEENELRKFKEDEPELFPMDETPITDDYTSHDDTLNHFDDKQTEDHESFYISEDEDNLNHPHEEECDMSHNEEEKDDTYNAPRGDHDDSFFTYEEEEDVEGNDDVERNGHVERYDHVERNDDVEQNDDVERNDGAERYDHVERYNHVERNGENSSWSEEDEENKNSFLSYQNHDERDISPHNMNQHKKELFDHNKITPHQLDHSKNIVGHHYDNVYHNHNIKHYRKKNGQQNNNIDQKGYKKFYKKHQNNVLGESSFVTLFEGDEKHDYTELRKKIEENLKEEWKKRFNEEKEQRERKKKTEEDEMNETIQKHDMETSKLEKKEEVDEVTQDEEFDKQYAKDDLEELEFLRTRDAEESESESEPDAAKGEVKYLSASRSPDSFYYNTAISSFHEKMEELYNTSISSSLNYVKEINRKFDDVYRELKSKSYPKFDDLTSQTKTNCNKLFQKLNESIKDKEYQKNILLYKNKVIDILDDIQKKANGKYIIIQSLIVEKLDLYKSEVVRLSDRKFYKNFRKVLGKRKMKMLEDFRAQFKDALRFIKDMTTTYVEEEYTKVLEDIYMEKKKYYKEQYSKMRRIISSNLDYEVNKQIKEHYHKVDTISEHKFQEIRQHMRDKIESTINELYKEVYVVIQVDLAHYYNQLETLYSDLFQALQQNKHIPRHLNVLEKKLEITKRKKKNKSAFFSASPNMLDLQHSSDTSIGGSQRNVDVIKSEDNEEMLLLEQIQSLKNKMGDNQNEMGSILEKLDNLSDEYESLQNKLNVVEEIYKNLRHFKHYVEKLYKESKIHREKFIIKVDVLSNVYSSLEYLVKFLLHDFEEWSFEKEELEKRLYELEQRKKYVTLEIQIRDTLFKDIQDVKGEYINISNNNNIRNNLKKQVLKDLDLEISKLKDKIIELDIKKNIALEQINYLTNNSNEIVPDVISGLMPAPRIVPVSEDIYDYITWIRDNTAVINDTLRHFVMTFDQKIYDYDDNIIFVYNFKELVYKENLSDEKYNANYYYELNRFYLHLEEFYYIFKHYVELKKIEDLGDVVTPPLEENIIVKKNSLIEVHSKDKDKRETIQYLERNILHIYNILKNIKNNNIHLYHYLVPDLCIILIDPDEFKKLEGDEKKPELIKLHKYLVDTYTNLKREGEVVDETYKEYINYHNHFEHTYDKLLWYMTILKRYIDRSKKIYEKSYGTPGVSHIQIYDNKGKPKSKTKSKTKRKSNYNNNYNNNYSNVSYFHSYAQLNYHNMANEGSENIFMKSPILIQYNMQKVVESNEKRYIRVLKDQNNFPYKLGEIKETYVLNKNIYDKYVRSNKLNEYNKYMNIKLYNIVSENKKGKLYLFEKGELEKYHIMFGGKSLIKGSLSNFLSHSKIKNINKNLLINQINDTVNEYLKKSNISYTSIIELIKYLQKTPNVIHIIDLIRIGNKILDVSNILYINKQWFSLYLYTLFELLGIEINMEISELHEQIELKEKENDYNISYKSYVLQYLYILRNYNKRIEIKNKIQSNVLKFLLPQHTFEIQDYSPVLYDFLKSINDSMDGDSSTYEQFKKKNSEFYGTIKSVIKKGIEDFLYSTFEKIIEENPQLKEELYFDDNYNDEERDRFRFANYIWDRANLNEILTLYFYVLNPGLRSVIYKHFIKVNIKCLKDYTNFDFKELFSFLNYDDIGASFINYLKEHELFEVPPLIIFLRFFFNKKNEELFTFSYIRSKINSYFEGKTLDRKTKEMIAILVYSFFMRISYLSVSYFDNDIFKIINKSDLKILILFHTIINKINYLLYCGTEKLFIERYVPTNLYLQNRIFKIDAVKLFHQFIYNIPPYIKNLVLHFFKSNQFVDVTKKLIIDFLKHSHKLLDITNHKDGHFYQLKNNIYKLETFLFSWKYNFSKNKNIIESTYTKLIETNPSFKNMPLLYNRRIKYDSINEKLEYKEELDLYDMIDNDSFEKLLDLLNKESINLEQLSLLFSRYITNEANINDYPKLYMFKKYITFVQDETFFLRLYEYLYNLLYKEFKLPQPIYELYYVFIKTFIEYILLPEKLTQEEKSQNVLNYDLHNKYMNFHQFSQKLFSCLFNFYYYDEIYECQPFGSFTQEEFLYEQQIFNILQQPFIDINPVIKHNYINDDYYNYEKGLNGNYLSANLNNNNNNINNNYVNTKDKNGDFTHGININSDILNIFIKQYITLVDKPLDQQNVQIDIFNVKYFTLEITKFVLRHILKKLPYNYLIHMNWNDTYIHIDHILDYLFLHFYKKNKTQLDLQQNQLQGLANKINFEKKNIANTHINDQYISKQISEAVQNYDRSNNFFGTINNLLKDSNQLQPTYRHIKYYIDHYILQYALHNHMLFKYLYNIFKNIHQYKTYFPTLSELYLYIDKRVTIINAMNNSFLYKRIHTREVIHTFLLVCHALGLDLYEL